MKKYTGILRSCPFCGEEAILIESEPDDRITRNIFYSPDGAPVFWGRCTGCGIRTPYRSAGAMVFPERYIDTPTARKEVINLWNTRKGDT